MASIKPAHDLDPQPTLDIDDPPSGVRLVTPRLHEPEPCSSCGASWGTRRLPRAGGPVYCRDCVPESPLDDFDALYRDVGGRG